MKTGGTDKRWLPEIFYICLLGLDGLLRRAAFQDVVLFKQHNYFYTVNDKLFETGICFNLYSPRGVGKKLEPLIAELMGNSSIEPETYDKNLFYREITHLSSELAPIIREADTHKEREWSYNYAIKSLMKQDEVSQERLERLGLSQLQDDETTEILNNKDDIFNNLYYIASEYDSDEEEYEDSCSCSFCDEFRKYQCPQDKHIDTLIYDAVMEIDRRYNS